MFRLLLVSEHVKLTAASLPQLVRRFWVTWSTPLLWMCRGDSSHLAEPNQSCYLAASPWMQTVWFCLLFWCSLFG